jgi:hypothetical protein
MLFMVGTNSAIIRAAIKGLGMRVEGIFRGFIIIPYLLVEFYISSYQYLLKAMFTADFIQINVAILKYDLSINTFQALSTQADSVVVINIVFGLTHALSKVKV